MITLIAACSSNGVIGKDNTLIWNVPGDFKRFKQLTSGNPIVMGRKTFESIGRPLPNRTNIVLTRDRSWKHDGCLVYNNISEILSLFKNQNVYVIGGGEIYDIFMMYADKIELTLIDKGFEGDTFFPKINESIFDVSNKESHSCDDFTFHYITYKNKYLNENV